MEPVRHKYMLHPETDVVFPYFEKTVKEKGWKPYNGKLPVIDPTSGTRRLFDGVVFEEDDMDRAAKKAVADAEHAKRINAIKESFADMPKIEFATSTGAPKLGAVEKITGFAPTKEERDEAFALYTAEKEVK